MLKLEVLLTAETNPELEFEKESVCVWSVPPTADLNVGVGVSGDPPDQRGIKKHFIAWRRMPRSK